MLRLLFFYFAGMTLINSILFIFFRNIVYSVFVLLIAFIHIAGLYILLNAEFIAAIQIIVYAGAILVLYLFVLMLFNPKEKKRYLHSQSPVGIFLGLIIFGLMVLSVLKTEILGQKGEFTIDAVKSIGHTQAIGQVLYTDFIFPFEVASFILLVAMLGAIVLAGRTGGGRKDKTLEKTKNLKTSDEAMVQ